MAIRMKSATICVNNQDAALDFYTNKLGFEKREDAPFGLDNTLRWLEVGPPGDDTVLILARGYGGCSPSRIGQFSGIVLETDDIKGTYEEWKSRGVRFTETPARQAYGLTQAQFEDQDGNVIVLVGKG